LALNRLEARERLITSRAEWDALIELVPSVRQTVPVGEHGWTLKEIIAHVDFYEWWAGEFLILRDWPEVDPSLATWDVDQRNQAMFDMNRDRALSDIRAESPRLHGRLLEALNSLTDAEFLDPLLLGQGDDPAWTPLSMVAGNSWGHYNQHRSAFEAILRH